MKIKNKILAAVLFSSLVVSSSQAMQGLDLELAQTCKETEPERIEPETLVPLLVQQGYDLHDADQSGCSPLVATAHFNNPRITQALLDANADINASTKNWETALHKAADSLAYRTVETLLQNKASTHVPDHNGQRPIDIARTKLQKIQSAGRAQFADQGKYDDALQKTEKIIYLLAGADAQHAKAIEKANGQLPVEEKLETQN